MSTTGLKKTPDEVQNIFNMNTYELDELYWFVGKKLRTETRENVYLMTMVSREPRQIVGFDVAFDKSPERIQAIVDNAPFAERYCTDGWTGYIDVVYPGKHVRNVRNKNDTFTVEGVNADLRHYNRSFKVRSAVRSSASDNGVRFLHPCISTPQPLFLPNSRNS
jgi:IS1 family transposase